jgi:hypothetical protein
LALAPTIKFEFLLAERKVMATVNAVLLIASVEANLRVGWKNNRERVLEYMNVSTGKTGDKNRSWCGDFVYWVLMKSNVNPMPSLAHDTGKGWNTISRFAETYGQEQPHSYTAQPGDLFYMRFVKIHGELKEMHHIGIVVSDEGPSAMHFQTINGNGGNDPAFIAPERCTAGSYVAFSDHSPRERVTYFVPLSRFNIER